MVFTDKDLQKIIGGVLKYGVLTVLITSVIGGTLYLYRHSTEMVDYSSFAENDQSIFDVMQSVFVNVGNGKGRGIIFLAVLLLFLTPLVRLLLSLVSFVLEKDRLYIAITLLVIAVILLSVSLGFSH